MEEASGENHIAEQLLLSRCSSRRPSKRDIFGMEEQQVNGLVFISFLWFAVSALRLLYTSKDARYCIQLRWSVLHIYRICAFSASGVWRLLLVKRRFGTVMRNLHYAIPVT